MTDGMQSVRAKLKKMDKNLSWLAKKLGITRGAISQWEKVPAERLGVVSALVGLPHNEIRPDLYEQIARGGIAQDLEHQN